MFDIQAPKIPLCDPRTSTELLDYEKEVTGIFMSGHPAQHHFPVSKDAIHYNINARAVPIINEIKR